MARSDFRTPRLYVAADLAPSAAISLDRGQANYLFNVLRLRAEGKLLVFNGREGEWRARIAGSGRRGATLHVETRTCTQPPAADLMFAFAPLKHARLDYLVQKAVEMGVGSLQPVFTQHTQVTRVNVARMRANVVEAAEQCGVLSLPAVCEPQPLARWLAALLPERLLIFCDEEAETADPVAALAAAPAGPAALLVGPEGGFADNERAALLARGRLVRLSLGPRVLRADTAAVAALALVQAARGDWR